MKSFSSLAIVLIFLMGCASKPARTTSSVAELPDWLQQETAKSWTYLIKNITEVAPKSPQGPTAAPGAVIAGLATNDPDYYFHWTRDSSVVMKTVSDVAASKLGLVSVADYQKLMSNYLVFSAHLQSLKSAYGLGEPRYLIDGTVDTSPWSRPQYDGPGLRALSVLEFLDHAPAGTDLKTLSLAKRILRVDLEYVLVHYKDPCFDVWEETNGDNYQTRLALLAALERASAYYSKQRTEPKLVKRFAGPIQYLSQALQAQWDEKKGYVRSNLNVLGLDKNGSKHTDLDSAVIVSVVETDLDGQKDSVLDAHIQATALKLENYFSAHYPINKNSDVAPAMGRYPNDLYVTGNPWFLITANYGQFYYLLAKRLHKGEPMRVTAANCGFVKALVPALVCSEATSVAKDLSADERTAIITAARTKGDSFLKRIQSVTPPDGQMGEQFDKATGEPRSAPGLTWSYEALLSASLARNAVYGD